MASPLPGREPEGGFTPDLSDLDVRYYLNLLWRHRLTVFVAMLAAVLIGVVVGFLQVPEYAAAAMLQIEPPTPTFMTVTDALIGGSYWQNSDFYNTQYKVLQSRGVAEKTVARLKLGPADFEQVQDVPTAFMQRITVTPIQESRLVTVSIRHRSPESAALWANTLADVYIEQTIASRVEGARRAYDWVQERLAATQRNMQVSRERLLKSYESQDLFVPEGSTSAVTTSIAKLTGDFIDAQSRRIALEAVFKQVDELKNRPASLEAVPQIAADDYIQSASTRVSELTVELARLREGFKEAHPSVQAVLAQIEGLKKGKAQRVAVIIEGMRAEHSQLLKREQELKEAVDQQKGLAAKQGLRATQLETLKKEAESSSSLYDVLLQKLNETDIAASVRSNNVTLVERAIAPTVPVHPNRRRIAAISAILGLVVGVGIVVGRDLLHNTIKNPDEVERYLHLDLLTSVPKYDESNVHLVTEAYQNLRTAMLFARKEDTGQVVLITGTAPQEGKTTTLVNIAKLLASSGERVLAVDLDLRRATLHTRLGLPREPGITDVFVNHEEPRAFVQDTRTPNLFALTAGPLPPNPPALIARRQMGELLAALRREYEWVLVDSPPLASVTDALLVARMADMVVFVVEHDKIDKRLVKRNVNALQRVTGNVLGAVLNAVDVKAKGYYYYYYHHTYGRPTSITEQDDREAVSGSTPKH